MKFCMVLEFFRPYYNGGGEKRYYDLTKRLVEKGHSVDILNMKIENVPFHEEIDGINVYHIGPVIKNPPIRSKTDFIKYFFSVIKWLRNHDYDIIDAQSYSPLLSSVIVGKLTHTPVIGTIYDVSTNNQDQWLQSSKLASITEKRLIKLPFTHILTISHATNDSLVKDYKIEQKKISLLYIGFDLQKIDKVKCDKKDENTILFVGRLAPHKHVDHLLFALKEIKKEIPLVKLVIVGKGVERENILKLMQNYKLTENVEIKQDLTDEELTYQMKKSNVLVLPSTREGFGMVLAEANVCYTPVIAYASGGVVEVVESGKTGYLIEPENVEELTEKIKFILQNKEIQEKLGKDGRKNVEEKFDWNKIVNDYLNLTQKLIK